MTTGFPPGDLERHEAFMREAMKEAARALEQGEVPVGCVIVKRGEIVARGCNATNITRNATRHAEFEAIDELLEGCDGDLERAREGGLDLYVTCEPCVMCAGALSLVGFRRAFFGCPNDKFGGCGSVISVHQQACGACGEGGGRAGTPFEAYGGICQEEAVEILRQFYTYGNPRAPAPKRAVTDGPRVLPDGELGHGSS